MFRRLYLLRFCFLRLFTVVYFVSPSDIVLTFRIGHGEPLAAFNFLHNFQPLGVLRCEGSFGIPPLHPLDDLRPYAPLPFLVMKETTTSHLEAGVKTILPPD